MANNTRRIGEGHRRRPGDVVAGLHRSGVEVIGRVLDAFESGALWIERDDGQLFDFAPYDAKRLTTIEEVDAPILEGRCVTGQRRWTLLTEAA